MNVIKHAGGCRPVRALDDELHDRECNEPDARGDGERSADRKDDEQQPDADQERHGRVDGGAAGEREDAAPATEACEHGERVADHRRPAADVGKPPHTGVGERSADEGCRHALGAVTDEHRDRSSTAEGLPGVPEARVAVADVA